VLLPSHWSYGGRDIYPRRQSQTQSAPAARNWAGRSRAQESRNTEEAWHDWACRSQLSRHHRRQGRRQQSSGTRAVVRGESASGQVSEKSLTQCGCEGYWEILATNRDSLVLYVPCSKQSQAWRPPLAFLYQIPSRSHHLGLYHLGLRQQFLRSPNEVFTLVDRGGCPRQQVPQYWVVLVSGKSRHRDIMRFFADGRANEKYKLRRMVVCPTLL